MANQKKFANLNLENAKQTAAQHTRAIQKESDKKIDANPDTNTIEEKEILEDVTAQTGEPKVEGFSDAVMEIFKKEQKSKEAKATIHVTTTDSIRNKLRKIAYDNDLKINQLVAIILEQFIDDFEKRNR